MLIQMPTKKRFEWTLLLEQLAYLLQENLLQAARNSFLAALKLGQNIKEFRELLEILENHKDTSWLESDQAVVIAYSDLLLRVRHFLEARDFIENHKYNTSKQLFALYALALLRTEQPVAALEQAEQALRLDNNLGMAWRYKAEALFKLGLPDWQTTFEKASTKLTGRALGLCLLDWGNALEENLQHSPARERWAQALPIFDNDAYYRAVLVFNMGLSCTRNDRLEEAEKHFANLLTISRHPNARAFLARAWTGFGLAWRANREFTRAEHAYRQAIRYAIEPRDQVQAWRGLGHTLRLMGQPSLALIELQRALDVQRNNKLPMWVKVDLVMAYIANGNLITAFNTLHELEFVTGEDAGRRQIAKAVIAHSNNDANSALEHLKDIQWHSLWAQEELNAFPKLRALLEAMGITLPPPPKTLEQTQVEVNAEGVLRVVVNGRTIRLLPTGRAAQVLVLLLEYQKSRSVHALTEDLFPNTSRHLERARHKLISKAVRELRDALGWQGSILENGGVYSLNPTASWHYDITKARAANTKINQFMVGVNADWADEIARKLVTRTLN